MSDDAPLTPEVLAANLDSPMWRLSNLYKIIVKGDDDEGEGLVLPFRPNRPQRRLLAKLHHRNIILKARQLGFTTLIAILWLDTAIFSKSPIRCGIVAHEREAAESIFRDKIIFGYDNLPEALRDRFPLSKKTATEIHFKHNGASIRVATSMRSGTTHRLHISELGKIAAKYPAKAREVMTGSIPTVPKSGITVIESTAEGQDGAFHDLTQIAMKSAEARRPLSQKEYRFHFFPWWDAPEYELDPEGVILSEASLVYFAKIEREIGRALSDAKRAWYVVTVNSDFAGDQPMMWQEYPSTPKEAFQVSTDGCYYAEQFSRARVEGRIPDMLPIESAPVWTFWDIGRGDMTAIWLMQKIGVQHRFIGYYENTGQELDHYVAELQKRGHIYARHFLPHEADSKRIGKTADTNQSIKEMLVDLWPGQKFEVVPRVHNIESGIQATRAQLASAVFCGTRCHQGLKRAQNYRKRWDPVNGRWTEEPLHNDDSHGADALRQYGQVAQAGQTFGLGFAGPDAKKAFGHTGGSRRKAWRRGGGTGMSA